jgi:hypothetical protein
MEDVGREPGAGPQALVLVDRPYLSDQLRGRITEHALPTVLTPAARALGVESGAHTLTEAEAVAAARSAVDAGRSLRVYTSSENALPWVTDNLGFTRLPELAGLFKDKARFRDALRPMYPDLFYRTVTNGELGAVDPAELPFPVVVKPAVGFFSLGVVTVSSAEGWAAARRAIRARLDAARDFYPEDVLGTRTLIIEEWVPGEEYAVDAYYDADGDPVVLGIWAHAFASDADTSDRVYTTSRAVMAANLEPFREWLAALGRLTGARDMPVHVELRRGDDGSLTPIEVNPLRFGGWCTTGDATRHAWGFSPYLAYLRDERPDWPSLMERAGETRHSIVVLDNSTGLDGSEITGFGYEALRARFSDPLVMRPVDWTVYPLFGFLFLRTEPEHADELEWILNSDLREFVTT